jgi:fibronectin type 3 domain-containing protein
MGAAGSSQAAVRAKSRAQHKIHLQWNAPAQLSEAMTGYNIYRSSDGGKSFEKVNKSPVAKPEYDDRAVQRGVTYIYVVKSVDNKGAESGPSNEIRMRVP